MQALKSRRYLDDEDVSALAFLDTAEADELLISNIQRYVERFERGAKRYRGGNPAPLVWARYLKRTIEVAVGRNLRAIVSHLTTIVLRYEPAGVKITCVNALVALESEKDVWPILVTLLNDPSPGVRKLCAKHLSKVKQQRPRVIKEITKSLSEDPDPNWPYLPNRHKDVMIEKIKLLKRFQDTSTAKLLERIAESATNKEVAELASSTAVALRKSSGTAM